MTTGVKERETNLWGLCYEGVF